MIILVMGVSGSGKTTIGKALAADLGWKFYDADDYHSAQAVVKMRNRVPLTDEDRAPWLERLHKAISSWLKAGEDAVLACSALKANYRTQLYSEGDPVKIAFLHISHELAAERVNRRSASHSHFAPVELLDSQFATLEEPDAERAFIVDVDKAESVQQVVHLIEVGLGLASAKPDGSQPG